jgi:hypothetical protein
VASREPFSRHRGQSRRADEWDFARAAEFVAHEYGWGPDYLAERITDEQLVAYFDAANERIEEHSRSEFVQLVEAARIGNVAAGSKQGATGWQRLRARLTREREGLTGMALETAIRSLAMTNPEYVVVES